MKNRKNMRFSDTDDINSNQLAHLLSVNIECKQSLKRWHNCGIPENTVVLLPSTINSLIYKYLGHKKLHTNEE